MKCRIVNSRDVLFVNRFDGSYHNADVNVYDSIIKSHSDHNLDYYCSTIFTSGRAKRMYTKQEFGYPFLSNADVASQNPLSACNYASKKYSYDETAFLKGGMILTGRVGAIGQTSFVPKFWEQYGMMGSDNIIRIVVKPEYKNGFIYAYLASKVGNLSFWKHATGGVQPFITDKMVGNLPIPNFPESFQKEVDDLIQQAAKHREQAAKALDEAHAIIDNEFSIAAKPKDNIVSVQNIIKSHTTRFEGSYYTSPNRSIYDFVINNFKYKPLKDCSERIFRPGIFKREYVSRGVTFLGGADIMMAIPKSDKKLSMKQVSRMPELQVQKGWILVTCGGTIGNTVYVDNQIAKCVVSQHVMRVVPKEEMLNGYLYAFLSSKIGYELITLFTYGSVIPSVEAHHLEKVPVPILDDEKTKHIDELVQSYVENLELSKLKETLAITMVEEEIEKWQSPTA